MPQPVFLSHFSGDRPVAQIIGEALHRISSGQIIPWYSSDDSADGGLRPGDIWFNQITSNIVRSKAVITILTPHSVQRPWIYFESGMAQALDGCCLMPVLVGIKRDQMKSPLTAYQCYQLNDYRSLVEFVKKVIDHFKLTYFDDKHSNNILTDMANELAGVEFTTDELTNSEQVDITSALSAIKDHIDQRFMDLLSVSAGQNELDTKPGKDNNIDTILYTATVKVNFPEYTGEKYLVIRDDTSVQNVLDNLYGMLNKYLEPYTYMEKWVLKNQNHGQRMILREIGRMVPAKYIFKPGVEWEAVKIDEEYKAGSSWEFDSRRI